MGTLKPSDHALIAIKAALAVAVLGGCDNATTTVVLDGWWNADFARSSCERAKLWHKENIELVSKFGCDKVTSCTEMTPVVAACALDPAVEVRTFESLIATEVASSPDCKSVSFVHFNNPGEASKASADALKGPHWTLRLDYTPGNNKQHWSMSQTADRGAVMQGEGDVKEIASKVCAIAKQKGAIVAN